MSTSQFENRIACLLLEMVKTCCSFAHQQFPQSLFSKAKVHHFTEVIHLWPMKYVLSFSLMIRGGMIMKFRFSL